ncbi:unnamed protein product [Auanema sp. JU1783]|nr:unnamed protein product [Auanema sp. JU1783]
MQVYNMQNPLKDDKSVYSEELKEHLKEQGDTSGIAFIAVSLERAENKGFGLHIVGGTDSPHIPASRSGVLHEGDRVISINGCLLDNTTHDEAVNAFRIAGEKADLIVESGAETRIVSAVLHRSVMPSSILIEPNTLPSFSAQSPVLTSNFIPSEKNLHALAESLIPVTPDTSKDDDAESVTSYAPSTHSIIDDVPRTPKRPTGLLDSKSVNVLTEVLYVSIGLGVIGLGAAVVYRFIRGRRS